MLDVSSGDEYYGPEGPYQLMAGKDASYAFAMMSLKVIVGSSPANPRY